MTGATEIPEKRGKEVHKLFMFATIITYYETVGYGEEVTYEFI